MYNCSSLKNLVKDFQDLAEICLLLLHLEVRVHCFYFLLPVAKQVSESQLYYVSVTKHLCTFPVNKCLGFLEKKNQWISASHKFIKDASQYMYCIFTVRSYASIVFFFQANCIMYCIMSIKLYAYIVLFQSNYAGPIDDLDPDSNVLKLNKDLTSMEEVLQQSLQPKKFK